MLVYLLLKGKVIKPLQILWKLALAAAAAAVVRLFFKLYLPDRKFSFSLGLQVLGF